jgi:hypothetical protein
LFDEFVCGFFGVMDCSCVLECVVMRMMTMKNQSMELSESMRDENIS